VDQPFYNNIAIRVVTRGFKVDVGCQEMIYLNTPEEKELMIKDFAEYMRDPVAKQRAFDEKYGRNRILRGTEYSPRPDKEPSRPLGYPDPPRSSITNDGYEISSTYTGEEGRG